MDFEQPPHEDWHDLENILPQDLVQGLSSNSPPSRAAIQCVEAVRVDPTELLQAATRRVAKLDLEIKKMQAEKEALADGARVRATLQRVCNTITSPIRRLPHDIIREIVHHAVAESYPSPERTAVAICLGRVCSSWRAVILSSPRLWSTLYLIVTNFTHAGVMRYQKAVNTWFQRAGTLPLQFFLYFDPLGPVATGSTYIMEMFLRSLAPWTARITRLGVGSHSWALSMTYFADAEWSLPNLLKFDILGQRTRDEDDLEDVMDSLDIVTDCITLFRDSRLLHTIVAWQEISFYCGRLSFIPWQQITKISLDEELCEDFYLARLLRSCPQLRNARLKVDSRLITGGAKFVHDSLETLELVLRGQDHDQVFDVFARYRFPHLTSLWIHVQLDDEDEDVDLNNDSEIDTPFPSLRVLAIRGQFFHSVAIANLLRITPFIQSLHLEVYGELELLQPACNVNTLCRFMTLQPDQTSLVALLEEFSFHYLPLPHLYASQPIFALDTRLVSRFVKSRIDNHGPLKKAVFSGGFRSLSDIDQAFLEANVLEISSQLDVSVDRLPPPIPMELGKPFSQPGLATWPRANTASHHCRLIGS